MPREEKRGLQEQSDGTGSPAGDDYVEFLATGEQAKGEFHCAECGYGVTVHSQLPACPMCGSTSWEQSAWSPFTRGTLASL